MLSKSLLKVLKMAFRVLLEKIDGQLEYILGQSISVSATDASEINLTKAERSSTEECLQICSQLSEHILRIQPTIEPDAQYPDLVIPNSVYRPRYVASLRR